MKRGHLKPKEIICIGKESNKIEEDLIHKEKQEIYTNTKAIYQKILKITPKEAKEKGVSRHTLWKIKRKIRKGEKINLKMKSIKKLIY